VEVDPMVWSRKPGANTGENQSDVAQREPIAVFRVDGVVEGWIAATAGRVSDALGETDRMTVGTDAPGGGDGNTIELDLDDIVAVAPAPRPPSPARVSRRRHPIEVEAGPYRVTGTVHLPIGADPRRYVATTGRKWLPLTECRVVAAEDEWAVEVVIVNLDFASRREVRQEAPKFG
jgi:hypothetical protein